MSNPNTQDAPENEIEDTSVVPAPTRRGGSVEPVPGNPLSDDLIRKQSAIYTRRSLLVMGAAAAAGGSLYYYLNLDPEENGQPTLLRDALVVNQKITQALTGDHVLAPTYPLSQATELRYNAGYGCKNKLEPANYRLQLVGLANPKSFGTRYVDDVTAWDYKLLDDPALLPDSKSFAFDPEQERHPEFRPGQGPKVIPNASQGGSLGLSDFAQPTSKQAAEANKGAEAKKPEGEQVPAQNMQQSKSGADADGQGKMAAPQDGARAESPHNRGRRERGQEEAGVSDSGLHPGTPGLLLTMDDLQKLPRHELVTQFKCIEGWSQIVHWGGFRLADFIKAYPPAPNPDGSLPKYVYMETPDGDYYCGFDLMDCMHPQSLLVTEMAGKPLTQFHGAPLRLHMPIKYGYKQIKRIGLIAYTNEQPDDYWTKLGYDWYAGL